MNGVLWKWTNYYNGWQPRWFVLKDGILSYYRSEDEVNSGSKGSINLSACDLNVNNYDPSRFEIIIPGEQKYFLKASNTHERQRWIVALGTGKACHIEPEFQMKDRVAEYYLPLREISFKESELRVYLELMNKQVGSIKSQLSADTCPDIGLINDVTSTLNAACDTFLMSLKDLVSISVTSSVTLMPESPPTHVGSPIFSSLPTHCSSINSRCDSATRHSNGGNNAEIWKHSDSHKSLSPDNCGEELFYLTKSRRETNFIIQMPHSFVDWSGKVEASCSASTLDYINSVSSLLQFLDFFEAQPIVSFKMDIKTYVKKLSLNYESDPVRLSDLTKVIIKDEVQVESVTFVLRSLHRAILFVECFLISLLKWLRNYVVDADNNEESALKSLLIEAFNGTMKERLNWLDRGQFTIITQSLPPVARFVCHLLCTEYSPECTLQDLVRGHATTVDQLIVDLDKYCHSVTTVNRRLSHIFREANIEL